MYNFFFYRVNQFSANSVLKIGTVLKVQQCLGEFMISEFDVLLMREPCK